jgi:hypothetical protein
MATLAKRLQLASEERGIASVRYDVVSNHRSHIQPIGLAHHAKRMRLQKSVAPPSPRPAIKMLIESHEPRGMIRLSSSMRSSSRALYVAGASSPHIASTAAA